MITSPWAYEALAFSSLVHHVLSCSHWHYCTLLAYWVLMTKMVVLLWLCRKCLALLLRKIGCVALALRERAWAVVGIPPASNRLLSGHTTNEQLLHRPQRFTKEKNR